MMPPASDSSPASNWHGTPSPTSGQGNVRKIHPSLGAEVRGHPASGPHTSNPSLNTLRFGTHDNAHVFSLSNSSSSGPPSSVVHSSRASDSGLNLFHQNPVAEVVSMEQMNHFNRNSNHGVNHPPQMQRNVFNSSLQSAFHPSFSSPTPHISGLESQKVNFQGNAVPHNAASYSTTHLIKPRANLLSPAFTQLQQTNAHLNNPSNTNAMKLNASNFPPVNYYPMPHSNQFPIHSTPFPSRSPIQSSQSSAQASHFPSQLISDTTSISTSGMNPTFPVHPQMPFLVPHFPPQVQSIRNLSMASSSSSSPASIPFSALAPSNSPSPVSNSMSMQTPMGQTPTMGLRIHNSLPSLSSEMQTFPSSSDASQRIKSSPSSTSAKDQGATAVPSSAPLQSSKGNQVKLKNVSSKLPSNLNPETKNKMKTNLNAPAHPHSDQNVVKSETRNLGFTKSQLNVLRAQILVFRKIKSNEKVNVIDVVSSITPEPLITVDSMDKNSIQDTNSVRANPRPIQKQFDLNSNAESVPTQPNSTSTESTQFISIKSSDSRLNEQTFLERKEYKKVERKTKTLNSSTTHSDAQILKASGENLKIPNEALPLNSTSGMKMDSKSNDQSRPRDLDIHPVTPPLLDRTLAVCRKIQFPLFEIATGVDQNSSLLQTIPFNCNLRDLCIEECSQVARKIMRKKLKIIYNILDPSNDDDVRNTSLSETSSMDKFSSIKGKISAKDRTQLRIKQKLIKLFPLQTKLREEIEDDQKQIMEMNDRTYRKFLRWSEKQKAEINKQFMSNQRLLRERHLKLLQSWKKKFTEIHWKNKESKSFRNRWVLKFHERMLRDHSKKKDEDRSRRLEALKNNDVDAYRSMLQQKQDEMTPGGNHQRYELLNTFLSQTEDYLKTLGGKISSVKNQQEIEEVAHMAASEALSRGLSQEEVEKLVSEAIKNLSSNMWEMDLNSTGVATVRKYYNLAHSINESVLRQPSMLKAGVLRDYQMVGLQWMISLYNNRLNGILADEMGLGKTVQVMALVAYLMEFKSNFGPHLIIVPNAVIVNWKSEFLRWLPTVNCIFYVGGKDQRSKVYSQEISAKKFNVLVTTYEFIMRDRSRLSKIDWKYLIIDEAQRMKDRESRLARDLDRFQFQRRLLLTGTPLQNDLNELWSLLNLLLPDVFDNSKLFNEWFASPFQSDKDKNGEEDDWLETEKKVIVIHRLHQILEPFMLRRRVEDVEGNLPPKVSMVLQCKMSAYQSAIYDWVKNTNTLRLDPEEEEIRVAKTNRHHRSFIPLHNKCIELRKICNHPYLTYPLKSSSLVSEDFIVRSCGKLFLLDRILIKLQRTGHRVLLFCTMTKLLDILEEYLFWRNLTYRRIDGTTSLEDRESAIVEFNQEGSNCFIFLLSIRAAGRGLNLQTADTVIIYDPDPNPQNEEQAVARAHRIGQKKEVRVIYLEAIVDKEPFYEKEDRLQLKTEIARRGELKRKKREEKPFNKDSLAFESFKCQKKRSKPSVLVRGDGDTMNDLSKGLNVTDEAEEEDCEYVGSIETLVRNNIQQHKIDMADEVINAGRFDQQTTHEERRLTLEAMLHDEERYQHRVYNVPSLQEVNRKIARNDEEFQLFEWMDAELDWPEALLSHQEVPKWLRVGKADVVKAQNATSKTLVRNEVSMPEVFSDSEKHQAQRERKKFRKVFYDFDSSEEDCRNDVRSDEKSDADEPFLPKEILRMDMKKEEMEFEMGDSKRPKAPVKRKEENKNKIFKTEALNEKSKNSNKVKRESGVKRPNRLEDDSNELESFEMNKVSSFRKKTQSKQSSEYFLHSEGEIYRKDEDGEDFTQCQFQDASEPSPSIDVRVNPKYKIKGHPFPRAASKLGNEISNETQTVLCDQDTNQVPRIEENSISDEANLFGMRIYRRKRSLRGYGPKKYTDLNHGIGIKVETSIRAVGNDNNTDIYGIETESYEGKFVSLSQLVKRELEEERIGDNDRELNSLGARMVTSVNSRLNNRIDNSLYDGRGYRGNEVEDISPRESIDKLNEIQDTECDDEYSSNDDENNSNCRYNQDYEDVHEDEGEVGDQEGDVGGYEPNYRKFNTNGKLHEEKISELLNEDKITSEEMKTSLDYGQQERLKCRKGKRSHRYRAIPHKNHNDNTGDQKVNESEGDTQVQDQDYDKQFNDEDFPNAIGMNTKTIKLENSKNTCEDLEEGEILIALNSSNSPQDEIEEPCFSDSSHQPSSTLPFNHLHNSCKSWKKKRSSVQNRSMATDSIGNRKNVMNNENEWALGHLGLEAEGNKINIEKGIEMENEGGRSYSTPDDKSKGNKFVSEDVEEGEVIETNDQRTKLNYHDSHDSSELQYPTHESLSFSYSNKHSNETRMDQEFKSEVRRAKEKRNEKEKLREEQAKDEFENVEDLRIRNHDLRSYHERNLSGESYTTSEFSSMTSSVRLRCKSILEGLLRECDREGRLVCQLLNLPRMHTQRTRYSTQSRGLIPMDVNQILNLLETGEMKTMNEFCDSVLSMLDNALRYFSRNPRAQEDIQRLISVFNHRIYHTFPDFASSVYPSTHSIYQQPHQLSPTQRPPILHRMDVPPAFHPFSLVEDRMVSQFPSQFRVQRVRGRSLPNSHPHSLPHPSHPMMRNNYSPQELRIRKDAEGRGRRY